MRRKYIFASYCALFRRRTLLRNTRIHLWRAHWKYIGSRHIGRSNMYCAVRAESHRTRASSLNRQRFKGERRDYKALFNVQMTWRRRINWAKNCWWRLKMDEGTHVIIVQYKFLSIQIQPNAPFLAFGLLYLSHLSHIRVLYVMIFPSVHIGMFLRLAYRYLWIKITTTEAIIARRRDN